MTSLADDVGQHVIVDFSGPEITSGLERLVREGRIGGVILFDKNVRSPDQVRALTADLQSMAASAGLPPLLVTVDQEGGAVNRLREGVTVFPSPMAIAATGRAEDAGAAGLITARELRAVGVTVNHAPVLDVNAMPANPIIGARAFGDDPEQVALLGTAYATAASGEGVLVTPKHFPGHGATADDSHLSLPVIRKDRAALEREDLVPFARVLQAGASAVMVGHLLVPALDPEFPASLSGAVIGGVLRGELGWDGLVITDSLAMKALDRWSRGEAAVAAVRAGVDLLLACGSEAEQWDTLRALRQAAADGRLDPQMLRMTARRIRAVKDRIPARADAAPVGLPAHRQIAQAIADRAVTMVRCARGLVPISSGRVAVVDLASPLDPVASSLADALRAVGLRAELHPAAAFEAVSGVVVAVTSGRGIHPAAEVAGLADRVGERLVVVGLGAPYELMAFPRVSTYLAAYGPDPASLTAVARVLAGQVRPTGRLPVALPGLYPRGHRAEL
ncbi:MAG: beta-N-acetylhexosaminidase [Armatimonadota bacterium]|nr:beta-N-acetylhexosaminidase [Armatimonadota bacterium]MDR7401197.1 beta-N-acetylhexosaminidase [Armatimonadota bacterium]MDR7403043.1 beta-N-acetylhexosaminidase [Armatimonadota bacterium]MDR7437744.1 beta-N-acetylhexosaminidase [Armatimonadota bacterium]MDR7471850.1 beta-N-acetylhexosaminidase [Armatimonadota bacterium]